MVVSRNRSGLEPGCSRRHFRLEENGERRGPLRARRTRLMLQTSIGPQGRRTSAGREGLPGEHSGVSSPCRFREFPPDAAGAVEMLEANAPTASVSVATSRSSATRVALTLGIAPARRPQASRPRRRTDSAERSDAAPPPVSAPNADARASTRGRRWRASRTQRRA